MLMPIRNDHRTPAPRRPWKCALAALALAAVVAGCGDSVGPAASLTGEWSSPATGGSAVTSAALELELVQDGAQLTGTGVHLSADATTELIVTGFVQGTVVMLTIDGGEGAPFAVPLQYSAVLLDSRRQMEGTLTYQTVSEARTLSR